MLKWISKKMKNNRGFTLVELVVVIAILGILAGIAVPKFTSSRKNAAVAAHNANVRTLESAANMYLADGGTDVSGDEAEEALLDYLQDWPEVPELVKEDLKDPEYSEYTVTVSDGEIEVKPDYVVLNTDSKEIELKETN